MEEEKVTAEVVETSTSTPEVTPEKTKNNKGLIATTIIMTILAVAGIAFGVYELISPKECASKCTNDSSNASNSFTNDTTENNQTNIPSIPEVQQVLENKYGYKELRNTFGGCTMMGDPIWDCLGSFNETTKMIYTIIASDDLITKSDPSALPEIIGNVDYNTLNEKYKYYFGNENNISKDLLDTDIKLSSIIKVLYLPNNDNLEVHFVSGIGGYTTLYQLNKISDVSGTEDSFTVTMLSMKLNSIATQSTKEPPYTMSSGEDENYYINIPESTLEEYRESLSEYNLSFIKEDGEYKLISIEEI
ncbi:hypothetical protein J6V85_03645 [Candidatus Saccharibacteria bacterium]|nr:hypothetical protein [Candidatus Saccharibacteria bacterium]